MTEPTRDALHAETLAKGERELQRWIDDSARVIQPDTYAFAAARAYFAQKSELAALRAEVERLRAKAAIVDAMEFYAEDASNLRAHPDVAWGVDGSLDERVAEWRNDLADRIERLLAAYAAATREGTDA